MTDPQTRLRDANPASEDDLAPSFERVWARIEHERGRDPSQYRWRPSRQRAARGVSVILRRRRARLVVALIVVLVAAAAAAAAVSLSGGSVGSVSLPGGGALCPAGYEYIAYAKFKLFYPTNYPANLPTRAGATTCYASEQDVENAGYKLAPPPADDTRIGPLYVADAPSAIARACLRAQRFVDPLYCPVRLPAPWITNNLCPMRAQCLRVLDIDGAFPAPTSYLGTTPGAGDLTVWAAPRVLPSQVIGAGCNSPQHPIQRTVVDGQPATLFACEVPAGATGGLVLEWQINGNAYGVAVSGANPVNRRLIEYVAAHLQRLPSQH